MLGRYWVVDLVLWTASFIVRFWGGIVGRGGAVMVGVDVLCFVGFGGGSENLGG